MALESPKDFKGDIVPSSWPEVSIAESLKKTADPHSYETMSPLRPTHSKTWIWLLVVFVALVGGVVFYFFAKSGTPKAGIAFSDPGQVLVGQPFPLTITVSNYSDKILHNGRLALTLPDGISFVGQVSAQRVLGQSLGDLGPQSSDHMVTFRLIATGAGAQSVKRVSVSFTYSDSESSGTSFENKSDADLQIGQPVITLNLATPANVISDETFSVTVRYQNNGSEPLQNIHLRVEYPPLFRYGGSSSTLARGNNEWEVGDLAPGQGGTITFSGKVIGPENSSFGFNAGVTGDVSGQTYTLNSQTANIAIAVAPLSLKITTQNGEGYIAHAGDTVNYQLSYKNNSDLTLQNITIRAHLIGELFDFTTPHGNASADPTNTFTWMVANTPELASLAPGEEGSVDLSIRLKEQFPIHQLSDKNYVLRLEGEIESPTIPPNTAVTKTTSIAELETKVAGRIELNSFALWRDAKSGIINSGPYPPRVNRQTQFTIHWVITNYSTDMANVKVSSFLQSGARWTGRVKSTVSAQPVYDSTTGAVTWNVGSIPATKGVVGAPVEAIFQVEITPVISQVGSEVSLLSESKLEATDSFTNLSVTVTSPQLTSAVPADTTVPPNVSRQVQPSP